MILNSYFSLSLDFTSYYFSSLIFNIYFLSISYSKNKVFFWTNSIGSYFYLIESSIYFL